MSHLKSTRRRPFDLYVKSHQAKKQCVDVYHINRMIVSERGMCTRIYLCIVYMNNVLHSMDLG